MIKVASNIQDIKRAVRKLPTRKRMELLKSLEYELFPTRLRNIVRLIRSQAKISSLRKITQIRSRIRQQKNAR